MTIALLGALVALAQSPCGTAGPDPAGGAMRVAVPRNFIFVSRDHERIADTAFLANPGAVGAEMTFTWRELEPARDRYALDSLRTSLEFLRRHGKRLFVQLQDVSFSERSVVPEYLRTDTTFHGGDAAKYEASGDQPPRFAGWVARRWDPAVRERFSRLLGAIAAEFDGQLEGIVLPETAVGFEDPSKRPSGFDDRTYANGVRENLRAARAAFARSCVIVYANFMPGDGADGAHGTLREIHEYAASIGAGVGGPDILPFRRWQNLHSLPLIAARPAGAIAGMAVQDRNLADIDPSTGRPVTVEALYEIARTRLRLDYIFWGIEEPYYSTSVLPFLRARASR